MTQEQLIEESRQKFKTADDCNRPRLGDAATKLLEICHLIEQLPASPLQTEISLKASELRQRMNEQAKWPNDKVSAGGPLTPELKQDTNPPFPPATGSGASDTARNDCEACDGKGWYATGSTENSIQLQCRFCSGTGVRPVQPNI